MIVKNAVNLTLQMNAATDEELRDKLMELVTQFDLYGVRSFVDSSLGIIAIDRRDVTPEQYIQEVHEAAERIREKKQCTAHIEPRCPCVKCSTKRELLAAMRHDLAPAAPVEAVNG